MGCDETKSSNYPLLSCVFQNGNEEQKAYCIKLKDNFKHTKSIRFEIKSMPETNFLVQFKLKGTKYKIQETFDSSDEAMNESLKKMYKLLDEQ